MADTNTTQALTAAIAVAYFRNHKTGAAEVPRVVRSIAETITALQENAPAAPATAPARPKVNPHQSVFNDHLVCLECGKHFAILKAHLTRVHHIEAAAYRRKYNLPYSYPLVAPDYRQLRSTLAKQMGLGRNPSTPPSVTRVAAKVSGLKAKKAKAR